MAQYILSLRKTSGCEHFFVRHVLSCDVHRGCAADCSAGTSFHIVLLFFHILFRFNCLVLKLKCFKYTAFRMVNLLQVGPIGEGDIHLKNVILWIFLCLHHAQHLGLHYERALTRLIRASCCVQDRPLSKQNGTLGSRGQARWIQRPLPESLCIFCLFLNAKNITSLPLFGFFCNSYCFYVTHVTKPLLPESQEYITKWPPWTFNTTALRSALFMYLAFWDSCQLNVPIDEKKEGGSSS